MISQSSDALQRVPLRVRVLQGAGMVIALTLFRLPFYWKKGAPMWMAALVLTSAALGGMVGGAVYYATDPMRLEGRGRKVLANVLTLLAYLLAIGGVLFGTMAWLDRGA